jgi:hypothetical protein
MKSIMLRMWREESNLVGTPLAKGHLEERDWIIILRWILSERLGEFEMA